LSSKRYISLVTTSEPSPRLRRNKPASSRIGVEISHVSQSRKQARYLLIAVESSEFARGIDQVDVFLMLEAEKVLRAAQWLISLSMRRNNTHPKRPNLGRIISLQIRITQQASIHIDHIASCWRNRKLNFLFLCDHSNVHPFADTVFDNCALWTELVRISCECESLFIITSNTR
jgi:hypothetical protein